jgi:predicted AAA+ superfamily ATPase
MYVRRALGPTVRRALRSFPAVLVTGPRQSGKTTFLQQEFGKGTHYLSLDDPLEREFARSDPNGFLDRFSRGRILIDEIQYVPEILSHIKIRIDRERTRHGRWLLTGSQQFQLMAGATESLAGRVAVLELLPFSLLETGARRAVPLHALLWGGGYPEPFLSPMKRELWLRSYIQTYVERDVRQLQNVRDLGAFQSFVALAAARHGQILNLAEPARDCGVSQPTARSWLSLLEATYLLRLLSPFFRNYGKRITRSPKLYFLDSAIVCALTRQPGSEAALAGAMGGALFEGLVVSEAFKAFAIHGLAPDLYFWRSQDGEEVDLLIRAGGKLHAVEIKLTATPSKGHCRSLDRLKALGGEDFAETGLLVCRVTEPRELPGKNMAIPWRQFPLWLERRIRTSSAARNSRRLGRGGRPGRV